MKVIWQAVLDVNPEVMVSQAVSWHINESDRASGFRYK